MRSSSSPVEHVMGLLLKMIGQLEVTLGVEALEGDVMTLQSGEMVQSSSREDLASSCRKLMLGHLLGNGNAKDHADLE